MLMTIQQRFLLDTLERLGCVRERQLAAMLRAAFYAGHPDAAERVMDAALRQLKRCNVEFDRLDGIISMRGKVLDYALLDAIDVMLTLTDGAPFDFELPRAPLLLRFSVEKQHIQFFSVVEAGKADRVACLGDTERVIILLTGNEAAKPLPFPNKQFFAKRQEDGQFRFFSARTT